MASHVPNTNSLKCSLCGFQFKTKCNLRSHIQLHTGEGRHKCSLCDKTYPRLYALKRHVKLFHLQLRPFQCPKCDYRASEMDNLQAHMQKHKIASDFSCSVCNFSSKWRSALRNHMVVTHSGERKKPHKCDLCPHSSHTNSDLQRHKNSVHSDIKPYNCQHCVFVCNSKSNLKAHEATHNAEKPFKCEQCPYASTLKSRVKTHHFRVHLRVKNYSCAFCDMTFVCNNDLSAHLRSHTKEKPYSCRACSLGMGTWGSLQSHIRKFHVERKEFKCEFCSFTCGTAIGLGRHKNGLHMLNLTYKCSRCIRSFRKPYELKRHMQVHLPIKYLSLFEKKPNKELFDLKVKQEFQCRNCCFTATDNGLLALHNTALHAMPKVILNAL